MNDSVIISPRYTAGYIENSSSEMLYSVLIALSQRDNMIGMSSVSKQKILVGLD